MPVIVEVESFEELAQAIEARADRILIDDFSLGRCAARSRSPPAACRWKCRAALASKASARSPRAASTASRSAP
jgi:nicotinate-nucleotide pyrophosphorylase